MKGIRVENPNGVFEEDALMRRYSSLDRVNNIFGQIKSKFKDRPPRFLLCLLPERKNSELYGPWKRRCLSDFGIITQCMSPQRINDQYSTNLLLKINAKLGGINSLLHFERMTRIPHVSGTPTIILGMDVSHGSPGHSDSPSIAAVVSSREWPCISKYRACVKTQSRKLEMIDSLFKPSVDKDHGIIRELLMDFYSSSSQRKPENISSYSGME